MALVAVRMFWSRRAQRRAARGAARAARRIDPYDRIAGSQRAQYRRARCHALL
jgi:hypothetical protein